MSGVIHVGGLWEEMDMIDWKNAVKELVGGDGDEGKTTAELAKEFNLSKRTLRDRLTDAVSKGTWEQGVGYRTTADNRRVRVNVYRPVESKGKP